jgi:hypothetical protein
VSETLDWIRALSALGATALDEEIAAHTLGVVLKAKEDVDAVTDGRLAEVVDRVRG